MKIHFALSALLLLATPACEKARSLVGKVKFPAKPAAAPAASAGPADVRDLAAADFPSFIATPGRLVVVDFHADWCGPCKMVGPVLEQVAGEFSGRVSIGKINVDQAGDLCRQENVSSIPDVRLYRDGKLVQKFIGAADAGQIRALFQQHTEGLKVAAVDRATADPAAAPAPQPAIQPMKKDWLPPGIERR